MPSRPKTPTKKRFPKIIARSAKRASQSRPFPPSSIQVRTRGLPPSNLASLRCCDGRAEQRLLRSCSRRAGNNTRCAASWRAWFAYGATKAAVIGLAKAIAADFIRTSLRANAICPGTIQSPSLDGPIAAVAKSTGKSLGAVRADFVGRQPVGRLGTTAEVAALAVFLASDESSNVTGQPHLVDGGMAL
jgi:NAD(P)-dependent dehydrogenase (short-subunit alcohol dehydrogenase family)